jgi:plastocyanin
MRRLVPVVALVILALLAVPAIAGDATTSFQCCSYSPNLVRILPGQSVTWQGANGNTFVDHPLKFPDATIGDQTDATSSATRPFPADGIYLWYCGIHGHYDAATNTVSGMSGRVIATPNTPPTAAFTASAGDVAAGTEVRFDGTASSDPDSGQTLNYAWDLDGDGQDDPGQTGPTASMAYANTGTTPRNVTVRLTVTDTNSDAVGPESASKSMVITVEPLPGATAGGGTTTTGGGSTGGATGLPVADTRPPVAHIVRAKIERTRVRVTFSSSESGSVTAVLRQGHRKSAITRDFAKAGRHTVTLKVTRKLRHRKVSLTLAVIDDTGNSTTLMRTLRLR